MAPDRGTRWWWPAGALLVVAVLLAGWGIWRVWPAAGTPPAGPPPLPALALTAPDEPRPQLPGMARSVPTKLLIRAIRLRAAVDEIDLEPDGRIETPPYEKANRAAWYRLGPSPGEPGSAVILGHVDSKKSVAVFFYLTRIRPGDIVEVVRADRRTAVFTVRSVEQFAKADFPARRVYADTAGPTLRLVTCGGRYDRERQAYLDNIVVFADLTAARLTR